MFDISANKPIASNTMAPNKPASPAMTNVAPLLKDTSLVSKENFIMNFSRPFFTVLVGLLVIGIIILVVYYYFAIIRFDNKIVALEKTYAEQQTMNSKLTEWGQTVEALDAEKIKFDQMVPEKKDLARVIIQLESLAQKYNLVFNSIENKTDNFTSSQTEGGMLFKQSYQVTLSGGDYFTLKKYLSEVENSMRIVVPTALIYSPEVNMFVLTFDIYRR